MSINPRSQPYRLDPTVDDKTLPQIVTNADEMFQILFEDIVALDAGIDAAVAAAAAISGGSTPGPKGPPGKDGASSSSSFRVPPGRSNTDFVPYVGAVRNVNLGANSLTTPIIIGGDTTTSTLQLRTTSAVGSPGEALLFQTGTNGSVQAMSIINSGLIGIGVSNPTPMALYPLSIGAGTGNRVLALLTSSATVAGAVALDFYTQASRGWGSTIVGSNVGTGALDFYVNGAADLVLALTSGKLAGFNIAIPIANVQVKSDSTVTGNQSGLMLSVGQSTRHGGLMFNGNGLSNDTWQRIDYVFSTSDVTFDRSTDGGATWVTWMKSLYTNGNIGFGVATPTAVLHPKAGTASASSAPLKFNSGTLLTTAEAGAIEFLTDAYYGTITTGAARKTFAFLESPTFTGTVALPIATLTGKVTNYNSIATTGWGVPAIYGTGRATAQTAANASVATYTVGAADGSFIISANVNVTTSTLHNFTVTCSYTDETNTARVQTIPFVQLAGTPLTAITNATGAGPYESMPLHIRCKASTAITIGSVGGGGFTTVTYNIEGSITQIS